MAKLATSVQPAHALDRRGDDRLPIGRDSTLRTAADGVPHLVAVQDLSSVGFGFDSMLELATGTAVSIGLPSVGVRTAAIVRRDGSRYGCRFHQPISGKDLGQAFGGEQVVYVQMDKLPTPFAAEPAVRKWHPAARLAMIVGMSMSLWTVALHHLAR